MKNIFFQLVLIASLTLSACASPAGVSTIQPPVTQTDLLAAPTATASGPSAMPTLTLLPATPTTAVTSSPIPAGTIRIEIFADQEWQSAGMILKPGQSITIQASGEWKLSQGEISSGPDGIESMDTSSVLPSAPLGSLIGRIEGGQPFEIGTRTTLSADRPGRLYLSMNDSMGRFGDNQGSLVVLLGLNTCGAGWSRLSVGAYAVVADESSDPNRVRSTPNTSAEVLTQLYPGSIVRVAEGPICANGLVFWKVESAAIPGGTGWTAEGDRKDHYLEPIATVDSTLTPLPTADFIAAEAIQWDETSSLPIASSAPFDDARGQQLIFHNGYVYIFGGSSASDHQLTDVYFSAMEEDGTLAGWVETTSLPGRYYDHVVVNAGEYVYLLTGAAGSTDVAYAPLHADGSVGNWIGTTPLNPSRQQFAAASYGNFIYVSGGNSGGNQSFVQFTSTKADGSLNNWRSASPLPDKLQAHTMLASNGYLYVFGGKDVYDQWVTTVYYSAISPQGTLGAWRTTSALPVRMSGYSTFESNGYVYLVGGSSSSSYFARILENHALDNWEKVTTLPNTRIHGLRTGAYNGFAYAMGGYRNGFQSTVYYGFIGVQQPPEPPTPIPASQTASASATPPPIALTPGPLICQLEIHQNIHVLDGTNLWTQPDVVNGSIMGSLPAGTSAYIINGPAWGLIVEAGVAGWWWEISVESNGPSAGWIWEGRIEECN